MLNLKNATIKFVTIASLVTTPICSIGVTVGQQDLFSTGLDNWGGGALPVHVTSGGPAGTDDGFLKLTSSGGFGGGSNMATLNMAQWVGNYTEAGIRVIECDMNNFGTTPLQMRIVVWSAGFTKYTSTVPVDLPAGSGWQRVRFGVSPSDLTLNSGAESSEVVLATVSQLMFRHSTGTAGGGTAVAAILGVDNITASAGYTVSGTLSLLNWAPNTGTYPVEFAFRNPGSTVPVYTVHGSVNLASGAYTVPAPPVPGSYDLAIKASHWLQKVVAVDTTSGSVTASPVALINGDCDGSNYINTDDYLIVSDAFDQGLGDPLYDVRADLDGTEYVNTDDYLLLSDVFDTGGDE